MKVLRRGALCLLVAALAMSCVPPGKGRKARAKYKEAQPLIDALEIFYQKNQGYPDEAKQLVPEYLPDLSNPFQYQKTAEGYSLQFSYAGPGMNHCIYAPKTRWSCSGYF